MSNATNPEAWAAQERLRFIERCLYWRGWVKRRDLGEGFGISLAQASADLQRYFELNPLAARYDTRAKRYRSEPGMTCVLHVPRIEEAMACYLEGGAGGAIAPASAETPGGRIARVSLPVREASPAVQRAVFFATLTGLRLRIHYGSLTGRRAARWRWIAPHAFGHDGYRWHVRAWCEENEEYRDFVLSRISESEWPEEAAAPPRRDEDWETWEELELQPHSALDDDQRLSVEADFAMRNGRLVVRVRRAMRDYLLAHLRLTAWDGEERPPFLEQATDPGA
ncbi:MAG: WYL domain-containing protein [Verrucomicrobiales bacterium]